jgi:putative ABC transport system ATP-binding protein
VLAGVDLSFDRGSFTAITGPSGAGKTRLLRLLNGLSSPTDGEVRYQEIPILDLPLPWLRTRVLLVEQEPVLVQKTVKDNLLLPFRFKTNGGKEPDRETLQSALQDLGIDPGFLGREVSKLSGGEKQRVALARALLLGPETLLLDEPTSALDRRSESHVLDCLERMRQSTTIVTVSHSPALLARADSVILMRGGRLEKTLDAPSEKSISELLGDL